MPLFQRTWTLRYWFEYGVLAPRKACGNLQVAVVSLHLGWSQTPSGKVGRSLTSEGRVEKTREWCWCSPFHQPHQSWASDMAKPLACFWQVFGWPLSCPLTWPQLRPLLPPPPTASPRFLPASLPLSFVWCWTWRRGCTSCSFFAHDPHCPTTVSHCSLLVFFFSPGTCCLGSALPVRWPCFPSVHCQAELCPDP